MYSVSITYSVESMVYPLERTYPKYAIAAVGAVVVRENKILLVKRGYAPGKGKWSIPGGVVEAGEGIKDAAKRELEEETGLIGEPIGILWVLNNIVVDQSRRVKYHYVIINVLIDHETIRGFCRPGGDALDVSWFNLSDIPDHPEVSRTVKILVNRINKYGLNYIPIDGIENFVIE